MNRVLKQETLSKVPEVTLVFWVIKIAATTLGETGGDTVTMTLNWGYLAGTALFLGVLVVLVAAQIRAKKFYPFLYWATIVASTTFGTTMADFADRSLGIGYSGGSALLFVLPDHGARPVVLVAGHDLGQHRQHAKGGGVLLGRDHLFADAWHRPRRLDGRHRGARLRRRRSCLRRRARGGSSTVLPHQHVARAAVLGGLHPYPAARRHGRRLLDKPVSNGGFALSRPLASAVIAAFILACLLVLPQRAGRHPDAAKAVTLGG